jgi:hypothetical protein
MHAARGGMLRSEIGSHNNGLNRLCTQCISFCINQDGAETTKHRRRFTALRPLLLQAIFLCKNRQVMMDPLTGVRQPHFRQLFCFLFVFLFGKEILEKPPNLGIRIAISGFQGVTNWAVHLFKGVQAPGTRANGRFPFSPRDLVPTGWNCNSDQLPPFAQPCDYPLCRVQRLELELDRVWPFGRHVETIFS